MNFSNIQSTVEMSNLRKVLIAFLEKDPDFLEYVPVKVRRDGSKDFLDGKNPNESHRLPALKELVELLRENKKTEYNRLIEVGAKYVGISYKNGGIAFKNEEELSFADFDKLAIIGAQIEKFFIPEMNSFFTKISEDEKQLLIFTLKSMDGEEFNSLVFDAINHK